MNSRDSIFDGLSDDAIAFLNTGAVPKAAPSLGNWLREHPFRVEGGSAYVNLPFWFLLGVLGVWFLLSALKK